MAQNGLVKCHKQSIVLCLGLIEGRFQSTSSKSAKSATGGTETGPKQVRFSFYLYVIIFFWGGGGVGEGGGRWGKEEILKQEIVELSQTWLVVPRES